MGYLSVDGLVGTACSCLRKYSSRAILISSVIVRRYLWRIESIDVRYFSGSRTIKPDACLSDVDDLVSFLLSPIGSTVLRHCRKSNASMTLCLMWINPVKKTITWLTVVNHTDSICTSVS